MLNDSNLFSIDLFDVMEETIPSNIPNLIHERSLEEDFEVYSSVLDGLSDEQAFNYLERNIEINEIISNESFISDMQILNYLEMMKDLRRNILDNHDLVKIHEEEDKSAFHYFLLEEYLFSSPDYDLITEHIIYTELIDGKSVKAVKEEINNLSKFNKIMKFIGLDVNPDEELFDDKNFRELK